MSVLSASPIHLPNKSFLNSWIADSFNINTFVPFIFSNAQLPAQLMINGNSWMIVSSMVQLGLSWWQSWICVWLGYGIVSPFIVLNARPGAMHHITFPVVARLVYVSAADYPPNQITNRTSFGLFGSLWCTFNRGVMAWLVNQTE